jgi:hypothetical protein
MQFLVIFPVNSLLAARQPSLGEWTASLSVLLLASLVAVSLIIVGNAVRRVRGTTLVAPLIWCVVSLLLVAAALIMHVNSLAQTVDNGSEQWWLLAATSTFCPFISLLGAKRPQHRVWQWIVVSFWIVAALPAIQSLVLNATEHLSVPIIWRTFYFLLLLLTAVNYLPTRYALAGLLATAGQTVLLWQYLPLVSTPTDHSMLATAVLSAAVCVARLTSGFRLTSHRGWHSDTAPLSAWTNVWLDFRDAYGLVWSARVMERIESLLQSASAPGWLQWDGFHSPSPEKSQLESAQVTDMSTLAEATVAVPAPTSTARLASVESGIRNLLRRFVSNEWIDRRLERQS